MARYELLIKPSAVKDLEAIGSKKDRQRIAGRMSALGNDPRPTACEKLSGQSGYRLRQEDYRVVYEVDDQRRFVAIVKVGHRRDAYR